MKAKMDCLIVEMTLSSAFLCISGSGTKRARSCIFLSETDRWNKYPLQFTGHHPFGAAVLLTICKSRQSKVRHPLLGNLCPTVSLLVSLSVHLCSPFIRPSVRLIIHPPRAIQSSQPSLRPSQPSKPGLTHTDGKSP